MAPVNTSTAPFSVLQPTVIASRNYLFVLFGEFLSTRQPTSDSFALQIGTLLLCYFCSCSYFLCLLILFWLGISFLFVSPSFSLSCLRCGLCAVAAVSLLSAMHAWLECGHHWHRMWRMHGWLPQRALTHCSVGVCGGS
jgi:hypothetical protein